MLFFLLAGAISAQSASMVSNMKVNGLLAPLNIDVAQPTFSWQVQSEERGFRQIAYEMTVTDDAGNVVWNSGKVQSALQNNIAYGGQALKSLSAYKWSLIITDVSGNTLQNSSTFETAFMQPSDWKAKWIFVDQTVQNPKFSVAFDSPQTCLYLRIDVSKLGLPASSDPNYKFVQLAEMEIYSGGVNVARSATLTANNTWTVGNWSLAYINDGKIKDASALGYTSQSNPSGNVIITAKLSSQMPVDSIVLYPRQDDQATTAGLVPNFPASFTIKTSTNNTAYQTVKTYTDLSAPAYSLVSSRLPYYGRNFRTESGKTISRARLYASALGVFTMRLNGQSVTENCLEPGESEYEKTILYSTYDVTKLLRSDADNALLAQVAGGLYNVQSLTGRYSKGEVKNSGKSALIAELVIEYADGSRQTLVTDSNWGWTPSPVTGSNWWGGEDYDARLEIAGVDDNSYNVSGWQKVLEITPSFTSSQASGFGTLRSRMYEPLRVVEEWPAVGVKNIKSSGYNIYMIDFGRNFAGQYRFKLKGKSGQEISLRCGESLNADGSVYMENYYTGAADTYDVYTFKGKPDGETWGPEYMYHGFRYLQVIGLDEAPVPSDFTAMRIRSNVDNVGTVETSNTLINKIHVICRDAIASQLYNSVTDCPQREKLGWLDVPNEMYNSLSYNFDMQNFYHKVTLDCFDAQYSNGRVPSTVPHFMSVYDDDPNWGGAAILVPYRSWKMYGDRKLISDNYQHMKSLINYYATKTSGYIMANYSVLSDWGQETAGVNPMVPAEFTITTTYYYMLRAMEEMATELGQTADANGFKVLANNVKSAFNKKFYNNAVYEYGQQSEYAMPLYYGLVDSANEADVAARLAERVKADGYKIKTGEIALKPLFMSLAKYGYNDIVYQMANQTDCPSYGYWVEQGYTTTPEYWDVGAFSQNHCMMDHIEEWFYSQLGGINNVGMAYDSITICPYIPTDMDQMKITTQSIYGQILSSYEKAGDGALQFHFIVPANSVATITVPVTDGYNLQEGGTELIAGQRGVKNISYGDGKATITVGSGDYHFARSVSPVSIDRVTASTVDSTSATYTLNGIRSVAPLSQSPNGIYIQKGKKVLVHK